MRKALLFLLLATSVSTQAQQLTFGLSGGASMNTVLYNRNFPQQKAHEIYFANKVAPAYKIDVAVNIRKWQVGLSSGAGKTIVNIRDGYGRFFSCACSEIDMSPAAVANRAWLDGFMPQEYSYIPLKLFLNRTISLKRFELYCGLNGGYGILRNMDGTSRRLLDKGWKREHGHMALAGAQTGIRYYTGKHFGFSAGIEGGFAKVSKHTYFYTGQLTAGILFRT